LSGAKFTCFASARVQILTQEARSERNKLQAAYNMAWLTTYTEQLTRIAQVFAPVKQVKQVN